MHFLCAIVLSACITSEIAKAYSKATSQETSKVHVGSGPVPMFRASAGSSVPFMLRNKKYGCGGWGDYRKSSQ